MPSFAADFDAISGVLAATYGPGDPPDAGASGTFRDLLIVYLSQQRGGRGGSAIDALDRAGLSGDPDALAAADPQELADLFRDRRGVVPAGLGPGVRRLAEWVAGRGGMDGLSRVATSALRDDLRSIRGLGPQTADRILLEALGRPAFPVGRSDYRILIRHGWIDPSADYDEARSVLEGAAPGDPQTLRRLAAWFGELAGLCRVASPRCDRCPLRPWLPEGGPLNPD